MIFDADWYVSIQLENDNSTPIYLSFQSCNSDIPAFTGGITLNMKVADVDACYDELKQTGVSFVEKITDHEWGDRAFSLLDPIGNLVYIYSERELHEKYKDAVKA